MNLPESLRVAIEKEISKANAPMLQHASDDLSARYRLSSIDVGYMKTDAHRLAYLAARLPATYAANHAVLNEMKLRIPDHSIKTMLDVGAGPATASWAASELLPELKNITLVEQDADLASLAKRLLIPLSTIKTVWEIMPMQQYIPKTNFDLILFSYSIGEIPERERMDVIERSFKAVNHTLVIIEPGTPAGFERIRALRSKLLNMGAFIVAPCTHQLSCPMAGTDWCHFSTRLERSAEHRQIKGCTLNYEDEKFSYLIARKTPVPLPEGRVMHQPQKRSGHVNLNVCTQGKLVNRIVSKREGEIYKRARKLDWGDTL